MCRNRFTGLDTPGSFVAEGLLQCLGIVQQNPEFPRLIWYGMRVAWQACYAAGNRTVASGTLGNCGHANKDDAPAGFG
jgi:hypothetical protein